MSEEREEIISKIKELKSTEDVADFIILKLKDLKDEIIDRQDTEDSLSLMVIELSDEITKLKKELNEKD